ncbi:hypothetical protein RAM19_07150 [Bartonella apihabitans]|uniref:hypothetical protein n=1 Tax=uncultured Bartonella sp. TaxID=104108 RepID=UPI0025F4C40A|nr:hypothetical protein [Bartonella apihabitans]WLT07893.1 hypothetical protein RAM19_07150 [Bartonella apihabitans]
MINTSYTKYTNISPRQMTEGKSQTSTLTKADASRQKEEAKPVKFNLTSDPKSFEGLSREDLASILLNEDGLYNEEDKANAGFFLEKQTLDAFWAEYNKSGDYAAAQEASIKSLDKAGVKEKQTFLWNDKRAHIVSDYEASARRNGVAAKNFDIDSELYNLLKNVHDRINEESRLAYTNGKDFPNYLEDHDYLSIRKQYESEMKTGFSFKV